MTGEIDLQKRNATAFLFQGVFFFIGYCFFDVNTVIPMFIESFTGHVELAGIPNTIRYVSTLSIQLLFGSYVVKVKNVPRYLASILAVGYAAPFLLIIPLMLGWSSKAAAITAFIAVGVMWISDGFAVIGYYDLLGRTLSPETRGRSLGLQQLIGGGGAVAGAYIVKRLLDMSSISLSTRYLIIFAIGGTILSLAGLTMGFTKDLPTRQPVVQYRLRDQFAQIPTCLKGNRSFRRIMWCQVLFTSAMMSVPYILILSKQGLRLSDTTVTTLLNYQVLGTMLGGAVSVFFAPRFSNRFVLFTYCALSFLSNLSGVFALMGIGSVMVNVFIMVVCSGISTASWAGFMNTIIDVSERDKTHIYMLINSIITLPLSFSGVLGGQVIKHIGYEALMIFGSILSFGALCLAAILLKEKTGKTLSVIQEK